ncbi:hypothetical protein ACHAXR_012800, partial [Thalassiosira sp. AJA248-18]
SLQSPRWFSSPSKKCIVINTVGPDRPGIVADLTEIITAKGGNVGESHSQLLGGHFALMMHVEVASSEMEGLYKQLQSDDLEGMTTAVFDAVDDPNEVDVSPRIGFAGQFKLSGADNPGIVHKLTSVLARNSLTIGNMKTSTEEAPFGGTELFTMEGKAVAYEPLSSKFDWIKIQEELQELGDSMNCDVEFQDVTGNSDDSREVA